jgi:hypothetical protein
LFTAQGRQRWRTLGPVTEKASPAREPVRAAEVIAAACLATDLGIGIATIVLLVETQTIGAMAEIARDPRTTGDDLRTLGSTLVHSVGGAVVLLTVLVLNIYKPRGLTRYVWRKQRERAQAARRPS